MGKLLFWFLLGTLLGGMLGPGCLAAVAGEPDFAAARKRMVAEQLTGPGRDITNQQVLAVIGTVPRHEFAPPKFRALAYRDHPLPIGYNQTMSQPYMVAVMTQLLELKPTDRVLEVGTGSGYQAAVLSGLVKEVCTIEIVEALAQRAEADLFRLGYKNVKVRAGDGWQGWPDAAPFDAIIVTCAPEHVPQLLVDQLKEGGRMVVPVGTKHDQRLCLLQKQGTKLERRNLMPVSFVPMTRK